MTAPDAEVIAAEISAALEGLDLLGFGRRIIQDAIAEAMPSYWEHRAETFEDCRPRPGDFLGRDPTAAQRIDLRCARSAAECRVRAATLRGDDLADPRFADDMALLGEGARRE